MHPLNPTMFYWWQGEGFYPCRLEVVSSEFNEYPGSTIAIMGGQKVACICRYNCMSINMYIYIYNFHNQSCWVDRQKRLMYRLGSEIIYMNMYIYIYTYSTFRPSCFSPEPETHSYLPSFSTVG